VTQQARRTRNPCVEALRPGDARLEHSVSSAAQLLEPSCHPHNPSGHSSCTHWFQRAEAGDRCTPRSPPQAPSPACAD
jgi:hypothetical protein